MSYKTAKKVVELEGYKFDSMIEAEFYKELLKKYSKSMIGLQVEFELQEEFIYKNSKIRPIKYVADFVVGKTVYDVKGWATTDFKIKEKMFKYRYYDYDFVVIKEYPASVRDILGRFGIEKDVDRANKIVREYKKKHNVIKMTKKERGNDTFEKYFKSKF